MMNEEMIELLIGKFIDSEITPAEQRLLDAELLRNPKTRRLLEEFQMMGDQAKGILGQELGGHRDSVEEVFAAAIKSERVGRVAKGGFRGIAAGLAAACLILGTGVYQLMISDRASVPQLGIVVERPVGFDEGLGLVYNGDSQSRYRPAESVDRTVDWYTYTDADGVGWLMETYRHRRSRQVVPAAYREGL